jgi:PTH1 family peptidyl-tRNA hydrolase
VKFIIGIGNPDKKYEKTRHNIGFMAMDEMNNPDRPAPWKTNSKLEARIVRREENFLVKPLTYVNHTGVLLSALVKKYGLRLQDFLIVCDDVNLALGKLRLRESGSAGGHHGLESIIASLGSKDFPRLRVGIGSERMPKDLTAYVLEEFTAEEKKDLPAILERAVSVCEAWEKKGFASARDLLSRLQSRG